MSKGFLKKIHFIKSLKSIDPVYWFILAIILIFSGSIYAVAKEGNERLAVLSSEVSSLEEKLEETIAALQGDISQTELALSDALQREKENVVAMQENLKREINQEVGSISGTVSTLEKLSKTDPELLQKYSKVFFLNEHYDPPRLVQIPDKYEYNELRDHTIHAEVWPYLQKMLDATSASGQEIYVFSAFRSFSTQSALKGQYTVVYGDGANQFSADQGYSEHQLGTTVDLITTGIGGTLEGFDTTSAYQWLLNNAYKYGFVLSYPPGNQFYVFEPWHWRFVGVKLATDLRNSGKGFYDLDQREIDKYLVNIFD